MASFRPAEHVRQRRDFERAYKSGAKVSGRFMTLFAVANNAGRPRLGVAATRKMGRAVIRNRAKRRARELFRQHKPQACCDFVVIPRREFIDAAFPTLEREFSSLVDRAARASRVTTPERRLPGSASADSRL